MGESHQLPAALFSQDLVKQVVVGVTGEYPERILYSPTTDILLVYSPEVDINRVKVQLECLASWMGKPIHLQCVRPSGKDLREFGVVGSIQLPNPPPQSTLLINGDSALQLPFFSGNTPVGDDEVPFSHWLSAVESARLTSSPQALHSWIQRSVREPAAILLRSIGAGAPLDKILSSFKLAYGNVFSFDELMKRFLNVYQFPTESVTDYVVRLEKAFAMIRDNYPQQLTMVDKTQHLRERFYRGLRQEIHQRLTPSYETKETSYVTLLRRARQLEEEYSPKHGATARGARDDPQMKDVIQTLKEIKNQILQHEDSSPQQKKKCKWKFGCYNCGVHGHWNKICPEKKDMKRTASQMSSRSPPPQSEVEEVGSTSGHGKTKSASPTKGSGGKRPRLPTKPQYYNPDPVARLFGRANEAPVEINGIATTSLIDTGATVTILNAAFCETYGLEIHSLDGLVAIAGTGGFNVPYLGYTVATLEFPHIPNYSEEVVMLVVSDSTAYATRVPLQVGTRVISAVIESLTPDSIKHLDETWRQTYVGTLMSCAVQQRSAEEGDTFDLKEVQGPVKLRKGIRLDPFEQKEVWGYTQIRGHSKRVVVCTESEDLLVHGQVMSVNTKSELMPHNSRVKVMLRNLSARPIKMTAKAVVGEVSPCNVVPPIWKPDGEANVGEVDQPCSQEVEDLHKQLGLDEPPDWMEGEDVRKAKKLIQKFHMVFSKDDLDLGKTDRVKYKIKVTDPVPFKERYRRIPPSQYEAVRKHLQEMLDLGAIRPSDSPWCSAVVLVKKKNGELRFCIDLRKLNARTVKDAYSLPRIDETLERLKGSCVFSSLDLKSGYWQVEIEEESKQYTAFTCGPLGFFECNRMPFGATNAPATFQRLMESCLGDLNLNWCIIYLDDVVVYAPSVAEHLKRLEAVFQKLKEAGLKLKPSKCQLFKKSISYLGHVVSEEGVKTDPKKIEAVRKWERPHNVHTVRRFLGFVNYYRKFIKDYSKIARPLYNLISGDNAKRRSNLVEWSHAAEEAFQTLINRCTDAPILAYADFSLPFELHIDASGIGLGAVLYQTQEGKKRVIAYASRTLSQSEARYPAHKLEFLALKWALTDQFYEYLYGNSFAVYTDNNPLTYVMTTAKLDACGQRWVSAIAPMNFTLHYKPGRTNIDADALSRMTCSEEVGNEEVQAILKGCLEQPKFLWEAYACSARIAEDLKPNLAPSKMGYPEWRVAQGKDPVISEIKKMILNNSLFKRRLSSEDEPELRTYLHHRTKLKLRKGVLFRCVNNTMRPDRNNMQLCLPKKYRKEALEGCHDNVGHFGIDRTLDLLRDRFYWPHLMEEAQEYVSSCRRCQMAKGKQQLAPLQPYHADAPMELVHMDYLTIEHGRTGKDVNILIITDHYSRFAQAVKTSNQTSFTTAQAAYNHFFSKYGFPEKIVTDQGTNFESYLFEDLCKVASITKLRTTSYHPQSNGNSERFNSTLINMIRTLGDEDKVKWTTHLNTLCSAYNSTVHSSTGFSPYWLLMGRKPRLAVDLNMGTNLPEYGPSSSYKYVQDLEKRLQWSHKLAQKHMEKQAAKAKKYYDRRVRCSKLEPGDLVLVKRFGFRGKHKIQDRWEHHVYEVLESCHSSPLVFRVRREDGEGGVRVLHRNLLLPFKTRILDGEATPQPTPQEEPEDCNQTGTSEDPTQEDQEDSPDDVQSPSVPQSGDEVSVSTRPWTRSQGPPPVLVGTKSLSKCGLNSTPSLLPEQGGGVTAIPRGYAGSVLGWATSLWEDYLPW